VGLVVAPNALAIQQAPNVVLEEASKAARALQQIIESKPKKVVLNGKTYLQFEDWQTLGRFYGVTAIGRATKYVEFGEGRNITRGFEATAEALLVSTNQTISSAEAICLDDEANWRDKPLYQLKSMAQTRAGAKALRNVLAWVVVMAGYAPTPAEEMGDAKPVTAAVSGKTLPAARVEEMCGELKRASNVEQLRKIFKFAYTEASAANERAAQDVYIRVKDARKKELAKVSR
jgi:hypothetical protein